MQISALSVRQLNVQGLVIYMTLALERRDFRGPGQLRFRLQPKIRSHHLQRHFQLGRTATTVLVELPNYGSCVRSEKGQTTPVSSLGHTGQSPGRLPRWEPPPRAGSRWEVPPGECTSTKISAALFANGSVSACWQFSELKRSRNITARYNARDG